MEASEKKVAIIGSGLIGRCWASLFTRGGYKVIMYDISSEQLMGVATAISDQLERLEKEGLLGEGQTKQLLMARITYEIDLAEAVKGACYIQECVPENVDLKKKVFKQLDALVGVGVVIASSTSCIVPSLFTADLEHSSQCIVAHPINPPHYIPLVEVIPAPWTDPAIVKTTVDILKAIGQAPVVAKKEVNGFIVNRLQYALIMEAWRLVEDGVVSPEDVDTAMSHGLGLRYSFMGPFETMHLNANGIKDYCEKYGENIVRVCESQGAPRPLAGDTLGVVNAAMETRVPLEQLSERRQWRDERLASLAIHSQAMKEKDSSKVDTNS